MADKNCPKCQGRGRVPWPEAGMLQDCDCVRAARDPAPATDADPWPLPADWSWHVCTFQGYLPHFAVRVKTLDNVWVSNGALRVTLTAGGGPELERVKAAVAKRNNFTPA